MLLRSSRSILCGQRVNATGEFLYRNVQKCRTFTHRLDSVLFRRCLSSSALDFDNSLIVTKSCSERIKSLQQASENPSLHLRVSVEGGGCSGFQYNFDMEDTEIESDDLKFGKEESLVVVDEGSFDLIKGSTIDYVQEMIRSSFAVVNNPQSESACGCGSSFAVKNFENNPAID